MKNTFLLVFLFLFTLTVSAQDVPPEETTPAAPIDNYVFVAVILGVLYAGYFLNKSKSFKTNN
jgi:hypothetical protein